MVSALLGHDVREKFLRNRALIETRARVVSGIRIGFTGTIGHIAKGLKLTAKPEAQGKPGQIQPRCLQFRRPFRTQLLRLSGHTSNL